MFRGVLEVHAASSLASVLIHRQGDSVAGEQVIPALMA
jgi:hypothetical protein